MEIHVSAGTRQFSLFGYHTMNVCMCVFYSLGLILLLSFSFKPNQSCRISFVNDDGAVAAAAAAWTSAAASVCWFCCIVCPCRCFCCCYLYLLVWQTTHKHAPHFSIGYFQKAAHSTKKITFNTRAYQLIATSPSIELNWQQIASTIYIVCAHVESRWKTDRKYMQWFISSARQCLITFQCVCTIPFALDAPAGCFCLCVERFNMTLYNNSSCQNKPNQTRPTLGYVCVCVGSDSDGEVFWNRYLKLTAQLISRREFVLFCFVFQYFLNLQQPRYTQTKQNTFHKSSIYQRVFIICKPF